MAMRSHYCGLVTEALNGQNVELCGWVNRRRDHGGDRRAGVCCVLALCPRQEVDGRAQTVALAACWRALLGGLLGQEGEAWRVEAVDEKSHRDLL